MTYEISTKLCQPIIVSIGPAIFNLYIASFDIPDLGQPFLKCAHIIGSSNGGFLAQEAHHWHCRLLRPSCGKRCCRGCSDEADKFAAPHRPVPLGCGWQPTIIERRCASQQKRGADLRDELNSPS